MLLFPKIINLEAGPIYGYFMQAEQQNFHFSDGVLEHVHPQVFQKEICKEYRAQMVYYLIGLQEYKVIKG